MLRTPSIIALGGHRGCELPAACQSHSQVIWHLWAGLCEGQKHLGRWEKMEKMKKGRYCRKSGDTLWEDVLSSRGGAALWGWRSQAALCGAGAPWKGCDLGLPLLQDRARVRGREHHAGVMVLWPSGSSPSTPHWRIW